eukprot:354701-Chlamydomonas_euryale.AAC.2
MNLSASPGATISTGATVGAAIQRPSTALQSPFNHHLPSVAFATQHMPSSTLQLFHTSPRRERVDDVAGPPAASPGTTVGELCVSLAATCCSFGAALLGLGGFCQCGASVEGHTEHAPGRGVRLRCSVGFASVAPL